MTATKRTKQSGPVVSPKTDPKDVVSVCFTQDGFTAFGKIWYRGETLSLERGSDDWKMTENREGESWMDLDEEEQIDRYGERMFRPGKWTGAGYDTEDDTLTDEERARLRAATTEHVIEGGEAKAATAAKGRGSRRRTVAPPL